MNVLGSKDELVDTSFSVKFRLQHMQTCSDCQQYLAEIDGLCAFCRSVQRLTSELRRLGPCLRGWAIDQTRVWVSIVQEEAGKWEKGAEAARKAAEAAATSKAASPVTFTQPVPEAGDQPAKEEVKSEKREPLAPKGREVSPGKISSPSEGIPVENEELLPPAVKQEDIEEEPRRKEKKTKEDIAAPEERKEKKDTKTKKEKAKKKSKKSRSRPRRSRRDSRRPRRDRNSRPTSKGGNLLGGEIADLQSQPTLHLAGEDIHNIETISSRTTCRQATQIGTTPIGAKTKGRRRGRSSKSGETLNLRTDTTGIGDGIAQTSCSQSRSKRRSTSQRSVEEAGQSRGGERSGRERGELGRSLHCRRVGRGIEGAVGPAHPRNSPAVRGRILGSTLQGMWGDPEFEDKGSIGCGARGESRGHGPRRSPKVELRKSRSGHSSSSMRRSLSSQDRSQGLDPRSKSPFKDTRRRRGMDREHERVSGRAGRLEERQGRSRSRKRGEREGSEGRWQRKRKEKEEEEEGQAEQKYQRDQSNKGEKDSEKESGITKKSVSSFWDDGLGSRSQGTEEVAEESKEEDAKEEGRKFPKQWELLGGELEGIELGEQRIWPALRGQSQGEEHQPEGPGRIDLWYGQGDAASAAHIGGHGLGEGPVGGTANSLAVLQESAFQQADRRSCSGGLDVELGPRPSIARESGQSGRLLVSAAEEHRDERRRHKLDGSPAGGGVAPREGPPIESRRSASCGQRKQGRVEGKEFGQRKGKGQERQRLPRMAPRRKRGAEGEGQRKEQERKRQRGREERLLDKGAAEGKSPEKEALLEEHKGVEKEKLLRRGVSEENREEDQSLLKTTKGVKTGLSYQDDPCGPFEIQGMSRMTLTPGEAGFLSTDAAGGARPTTSAQFSNKEDGTTLEDGCCGNAAALAAASPSMVGFRRSPLGAAEDCFRAGGPEKDARSRDEGSGEGQFSKELGGCKFSAVSPLLRSLLISTEKELKFRRGETQTTGDVFPLPTNIDLLRGVGKLDEDALLLLSCVCLGLNSYAGTALESSAPLSKVQKFFLEGLVASVEDVMGWSEVFGDISWQSFFQLKSLDYVGDEVATARVTSWANLQSAIPVEVGSVPLSQVVGPGCAHYVDHFEDFLLDEKSRTYTRPPKVMVTEHDWDGVCEGLNYLGWNMWSHGRK